MPLFIILILSAMMLADLAWWWRADQVVRTLPKSRWWRLGVAGFMLVAMGGLMSVFAIRLTGDGIAVWFVRYLVTFVFIWHFLLLPIVTVPNLLVAIGSLLARLFRRTPAATIVNKTDLAGPAFSKLVLGRREFISAAVAAVPPLVTIIGSGVAMSQLDEFRIRRFTLPMAGLPRDLDGLTIAQVTDAHIGDFTRGRTIDRIVEGVNRLKPDLIVQTGDLINRRLSDAPAALDMINRMHARHGIYMCEGNHDLMENPAEFRQLAKASGLPMLIGEAASRTINGVPVQMLGIGWAGRTRENRNRQMNDEVLDQQVAALNPLRDPAAFSILLAHHPHAFDAAQKHNIPLTFAGHTHGGQFHATEQLGFGPFMYRYWSGLYQKDDAACIVSNGVGNWFPLRINAPAEIIHVTLRRG